MQADLGLLLIDRTLASVVSELLVHWHQKANRMSFFWLKACVQHQARWHGDRVSSMWALTACPRLSMWSCSG